MAGTWMVRAGRGGALIDEFSEKGCIALGWAALESLEKVKSREELRSLVQAKFPGSRPGPTQSIVSQLARFLFDFQKGDQVVSYDPERRELLLGEIRGDYSYDPETIPEHPHVRKVKWRDRVSRDDLSVAARNSLGAIQTLFAIDDTVWSELDGIRRGTVPVPARSEPTSESETSELEDIHRGLVDRAHEFIKDRLQKLDWDEMQDLVAGILRAMGYKTRVVGKGGGDRGQDVIASPDGLGLESPRIRVEVKHRPREAMGSSEVRSFIGSLRSGDKGLYVSTGGFSKEAHYEAERSNVPVTLVSLDDLVRLLVQHYESLDSEARALVPLTRIYWPTEL